MKQSSGVVEVYRQGQEINNIDYYKIYNPQISSVGHPSCIILDTLLDEGSIWDLMPLYSYNN